jgi:hypothetical protein
LASDPQESLTDVLQRLLSMTTSISLRLGGSAHWPVSTTDEEDTTGPVHVGCIDFVISGVVHLLPEQVNGISRRTNRGNRAIDRK